MLLAEALKEFTDQELTASYISGLHSGISPDKFDFLAPLLVRLRSLVPDGKNHYRLTLGPDEHNPSFLFITGHKPNDSETYGLGLTPWSEWLAAELNPTDIEEYGLLSFLVHCFDEMTVYGDTEEEIAEFAADLQGRSDEMKEHPERGIPMEEVFRRVMNIFEDESTEVDEPENAGTEKFANRWSYGMVRVVDEKSGCPSLGLYEIYYNEKGKPTSRTCNPISFVVDDEEGASAEMIRSLEKALADTKNLGIFDDDDLSGVRAVETTD